MKAISTTLKQMLSETMSGGKPTLKYRELSAILTMAANLVNDRPIALNFPTSKGLVPFTVNQLLTGLTLGASRVPHAVQGVEFVIASRYQQDLLNMWWKLWKEQGFASLPPYGHLTEAKRHAGL